MTTVILDGPSPAPGGQFCVICAGIWKFMALQGPLAEKVKALEADGQGGIERIGLRVSYPCSAAVAFGWFPPMAPPPMGNGMMPVPAPLCWTHLMGMDLRNSAIIPASAGQMPMGGLGGAVMLDRRH